MASVSQTWCHCSECDQKGGLDAEGKPKGTAFATRLYKAHALRVKRAEADRLAAEQAQSALVDDASTQLFTAALLDDGPDLDALPSKLWTSRAEFQQQRAPYITPTTQTDISSTSSIDAIADGVRRLMVSSDDPAACPDPVDAIAQGVHRLTVSSDDPPLRLDSVDADTALPPDGRSPAHDTPRPRRPGMSKKDRSQYTINTLAILELVRAELHKCKQQLSCTPSLGVKEARTAISNARRTIERTTRSTADIDKLKKELVDTINNIEAHLLVLDPQSEAKNLPKDYATGK
jgi:hypothetical protein